MHVYKIRIDTKVSGLHKYVIFCHFQNRQKKLFSVFSKIFCQYKKFIYICTRNQIRSHGRLAQLVQSIWFTPRGSGVRIPQRPRNRSLTKKFVRLFLFLTAFIQTFFILLPYNSGKRVNFAV